jgi:hypothetical protein
VKVITVKGGYSYVTELSLKKGDVIQATFGHGLAYLIVETVGTKVPSGYGGPLCQVSRKVTGEEAEAVIAYLDARDALAAAEERLEAVRPENQPTEQELRHEAARFIR